MPFEWVVNEVNAIVRGWGSYFHFRNCRQALAQVRNHVEQRMVTACGEASIKVPEGTLKPVFNIELSAMSPEFVRNIRNSVICLIMRAKKDELDGFIFSAVTIGAPNDDIIFLLSAKVTIKINDNKAFLDRTRIKSLPVPLQRLTHGNGVASNHINLFLNLLFDSGMLF